ncbi:pre-mRNA-splicing factor CWC22 homolog [Vespa velutina]|uniref:pre-mRNA-splicing factor CWC22 homolog n=1 Tax=Vespa velutina TaxID=202808 RepID=UPI001FB3433B|nr:pre-mRNA-splicing factor CWC22 homolog [Vespa velutina]XP_047362551.1 pre-mRNA-splicing factor CWC22 homolog [Vespa velutina]XP_047362553.1 pre-mRNA-splicing factor CWC22 homolog [Vespa velutina]
MTTVLSDEDGGGGNAMKLKQKLLNRSNVKEETRSFLNFSRENLSISQADLERGFNKQRFRPNKYTVLSTVALLIALLCLALETWKLRCSLVNSREIEELKRDVKSLKHRFLQQDLLDELKAFEEQLYAGESADEEDPGEVDIDNAEYDSNYDDESSSSSSSSSLSSSSSSSSSHDYSSDYRTLSIISKNSDISKGLTTKSTITKTKTTTSTSTSKSMSTDFESTSTQDPVSDKALVELFAALRKAEAKQGEKFEKNVRESHRNLERERFENVDLLANNEDNIKERLDDDLRNKEKNLDAVDLDPIKRKRSIREENHSDDGAVTNRTSRQRNQTQRKIGSSRHRFHNNDESGKIAINDRSLPESIISSERHPPKKFNSHTHPETSRAFPSSRYNDDNLSDEIARSILQPDEGEKDYTDRANWKQAHDNMEISNVSKGLRRAVNRRHLRAPRQVCAIHYGADSILFSEDDEHTGNGRARHGNGIFKAWRPSDWVSDLGMNKYFALANDGKLTVHEPGLYLVYAQIHYLDEHDENGFHLLINNRPLFQCTIFSPSVGHKSRSCFSAQVTILQAGDILILKDIGIDRYTLFQHDKSFFGLVKLGESRQQRHPSTQLPP